MFDYLGPFLKQSEWLEASQHQHRRVARGTPTVPLSTREAAWLFVWGTYKLKLFRGGNSTHYAREMKSWARPMSWCKILARWSTGGYRPTRWIDEVKTGGLAELRRFAERLYRDYDAVRAAFSLEYSNGRAQSQVHRLKLIKLQGQGRANFDILGLHQVLHGSVMRPDHQKRL